MKDYWNLEKGLKDFSMGMQRATESEDMWSPLHKVVPPKWRDGFMYMGKYSYKIKDSHSQAWNMELYDYKHGITRRYLHISKSGKCYCHIKTTSNAIYLTPCSKKEALNYVFEGINQFGAKRETAYDEAYKTERNKALTDAGFITFDLSPGKIKKSKKGFSIEEEF